MYKRTQIVWLLLGVLSITLCPVTNAELAYLCEYKYPGMKKGIFAQNYQDYRECGDACFCKAIETLCFIYEEDETTFEVTSFNYADTCIDCLCNWWTDEQEWERITEREFGVIVEPPKKIQVPQEGQLVKKDQKDFPMLLPRQESPASLNQTCTKSVVCEKWMTASWSGESTVESYPCDYLIYDVCMGTFACKCSNGYWMETNAMTNQLTLPSEANSDDKLDWMGHAITSGQDFAAFAIISTCLLISFILTAFIAIVWCCHPDYQIEDTSAETKKDSKPATKAAGGAQEMTKIIPYGEQSTRKQMLGETYRQENDQIWAAARRLKQIDHVSVDASSQPSQPSHKKSSSQATHLSFNPQHQQHYPATTQYNFIHPGDIGRQQSLVQRVEYGSTPPTLLIHHAEQRQTEPVPLQAQTNQIMYNYGDPMNIQRQDY